MGIGSATTRPRLPKMQLSNVLKVTVEWVLDRTAGFSSRVSCNRRRYMGDQKLENDKQQFIGSSESSQALEPVGLLTAEEILHRQTRQFQVRYNCAYQVGRKNVT